jgi:hypothetical protein
MSRWSAWLIGVACGVAFWSIVRALIDFWQAS